MGIFDKIFKKGKKEEDNTPKFDGQKAENAQFRLTIKMNEQQQKIKALQDQLYAKIDAFNASPDPISRQRLSMEGSLIQKQMESAQASWKRTFNEYVTASRIGEIAVTEEDVKELEQISFMTAKDIEAAGQALVATLKVFDQEQASKGAALDAIDSKLNEGLYGGTATATEGFEAAAAQRASAQDAKFVNTEVANSDLDAQFEEMAKQRKAEADKGN